MKPYSSADEFVEKLKSDEGLPLPTPPVTQTGLVDRAKSGKEKIVFAPGTQCSNLNWIEVPLSIIEQVDHLGNQRCGEDEHPYVRLHLTRPGTVAGDAIFLALAGILQQPGTAPGPMTPPTRPIPTAPVPPPPVPPMPPAGQFAAPASRQAAPLAGGYASPASRHVASASRHTPNASPGFDAPGPVSGCG